MYRRRQRRETDNYMASTGGVPAATGEQFTLVLVHGANCTAACWEPFQSWFAERGYASLGVNLRGCFTSLADFSADLAQAISGGVGDSFVLIGHGLGGAVVQRYLFDLVRLADRPCPVGAVLMCSTDEASGSMLGKMNPLTATPERVRALLFSDCAADEAVRACCQQAREWRGFPLRATMWDAGRFPCADGSHGPRCSIAMRVLGAARDQFVTREMLLATAATYNASLRIFTGMGHALMLDSGWQDVAEDIAAFAQPLVTAASQPLAV
jgi:alpha-beta hydrolase superfamily lysophospholipase